MGFLFCFVFPGPALQLGKFGAGGLGEGGNGLGGKKGTDDILDAKEKRKTSGTFLQQPCLVDMIERIPVTLSTQPSTCHKPRGVCVWP